MRHPGLPSNMSPRRLEGFGEPFPNVPVQPALYSWEDARRAAGYIHVERRDAGVNLGQVCAVAVYSRSRLAEDTHRYTLLLLTSKHTLEWETSDSEQEAIYELQESRQRLKEEYDIEITMPANAAWNWSSPDTQFEFFADENDQNDVALVAVELAKDEPLPYPTIMPDINNVVLGDWSHGTNFFGIVFRSGDGDEEEGEEMFPHYVDFKSSSVELGGTLHHQAKTEEGDSGGMLYCYADDPEKLVPACVITVQWIGVDHSHTYSVKQVGALLTLWKMTRQTLDERNSRMLYCGTKFASSDRRPQPPAPMRHPEQPFYMALSRLESICDFFSDATGHIVPYSLEQSCQTTGYINAGNCDHPQIKLGVVSGIAAFVHSRLAGDSQRYTLLLLTCQRALKWAETQEPIYKIQGGKRRLKEQNKIEIIMPANKAWKWSSSDNHFQFSTDENCPDDIAVIGIALADGQPLPYPTTII